MVLPSPRRARRGARKVRSRRTLCVYGARPSYVWGCGRRSPPARSLFSAAARGPPRQHATAEPGSLQLLDLALSTLAHHAAEQGLELPRVAGARITARTVELLLAPLATDRDDEDDTRGDEVVPAPFTRHGPDRRAMDRTHERLDPDEAALVPAPYPGLVTLGSDPDGNHLLINLTVSRVLLLDGTPTAVRDTARVLALEAATSTRSDHSEILTVGLGNELPTLLSTSRLRTLPHLKAARTDLAELLLEQRQAANTDDAPPGLPWAQVCAGYRGRRGPAPCRHPHRRPRTVRRAGPACPREPPAPSDLRRSRPTRRRHHHRPVPRRSRQRRDRPVPARSRP